MNSVARLLLLSLLVFSATHAWWNTDWQYRRNITLANPASSDRVNEPVYVQVDTNGHAKSDCSDYRVTTSGETEIPSAILNCSNGNGVVVFNANIPSSSSATYEVYYGNPNPPSSNYSYSYSSSSAFVLFAKNDGSFGRFDDCYDSPLITGSFYGETMRVTDVNSRQLHAGKDGARSNACHSHPFTDASFAVSSYPVMQLVMKIPLGSRICLFHYMCTSLTSGCSWYVTACTPSGSSGSYAHAPNFFTLLDDNQWHYYTYDLSQIGRPYENTFEFYVTNGQGYHQFFFDNFIFTKSLISSSLASEETASVCGANGCEPGEDYTSCPQDCCESDCTGANDNILHYACNGYNSCSILQGCDSHSPGYKYCLNSSVYVSCPFIQAACGGGLFCNNGECSSCSSVCDGVCSGSGSACYGTDPDCDASGGATRECCGNGVCNGTAGESCSNCEADCGKCQITLGVCGNGICERNYNATYSESCSSCPQDCGSCAPSICNETTCSGSCGTCMEYQCHGNNCVCDYVSNCCGNNICETNESYSNCPRDCNPKSIDVVLTSPASGSVFMRGESIPVKVNLTYDEGIIGLFANVSVSTPDGSFALNDSDYNGVYEGIIPLLPNSTVGNYPITITARKGVTGSASASVVVSNAYSVSINSDKDRYTKNEKIRLSGAVLDARGAYVSRSVRLLINNESPVVNAVNGFFNYTYLISLLDPSGEWTIKAVVSDSYNNTGSASLNVNVTKPGVGSYYQVNILSPSFGIVERGDVITVTAKVMLGSEAVDNATVSFKGFDGSVHTLTPIGNGSYSSSYKVGNDAPVGKQFIEVTASKGIYTGTAKAWLIVEPAEINLKVLSPTKSVVSTGENVKLTLRATYPDGRPVESPEISAVIGGKNITLKRVSEGVYSASYVVGEGLNSFGVNVVAGDKAGNSGEINLSFNVSGISPSYYFRKFWYIIYPLIGAAGVAAWFGGAKLYKSRSLEMLKQKKKELINLKKDAQIKYYRKKVIDTEEYERLISKLDSQLEVIKSRIKSFKKRH